MSDPHSEKRSLVVADDSLDLFAVRESNSDHKQAAVIEPDVSANPISLRNPILSSGSSEQSHPQEPIPEAAAGNVYEWDFTHDIDLTAQVALSSGDVAFLQELCEIRETSSG